MSTSKKTSTQIEKFREAARELETDDSEERFDKIVKRIAKAGQREEVMSDQGYRRVFGGAVNADEVWAWIDQVLEDAKDRKVLGIRVSNHLHQMGIAGERNGVKIAMSERLYPDNIVEVVVE